MRCSAATISEVALQLARSPITDPRLLLVVACNGRSHPTGPYEDQGITCGCGTAFLDNLLCGRIISAPPLGLCIPSAVVTNTCSSSFAFPLFSPAAFRLRHIYMRPLRMDTASMLVCA